MKPKPNENTYSNRVTQFEKDQKPLNFGAGQPLPSKPKVAAPPQNLQAAAYLQARLKVLKTYRPETLALIERMEKTGDYDNKTYERFVKDQLLAAGDIPTHGLFNRTQECGCYMCRKR